MYVVWTLVIDQMNTFSSLPDCRASHFNFPCWITFTALLMSTTLVHLGRKMKKRIVDWNVFSNTLLKFHWRQGIIKHLNLENGVGIEMCTGIPRRSSKVWELRFDKNKKIYRTAMLLFLNLLLCAVGFDIIVLSMAEMMKIYSDGLCNDNEYNLRRLKIKGYTTKFSSFENFIAKRILWSPSISIQCTFWEAFSILSRCHFLIYYIDTPILK